MSKLLLLSVLLMSALAFNIQKESSPLDTIISTPIKAINWPFTTCGDGHWTIEKLTLSAQPVRNSNDSIVVLGTASDSISFKLAVLNVKLNGVPLHTQNVDFVQSYDNGDNVQFKFNNFIPGFAPSGAYGLTFQFMNSDNKPQGCISFAFKL